MVIAVERCFCVISPFRSQGILHSRTMAIIIVVATVVIVGGHFIVAAQWRVVCIFDPISGTSLDAVFNSQFYFSNTGSPSTARFTSPAQVVHQQPGLLQQHRYSINIQVYFTNTGSSSTATFTSATQVVRQQPGLLQQHRKLINIEFFDEQPVCLSVYSELINVMDSIMFGVLLSWLCLSVSLTVCLFVCLCVYI